MTPSTEAVAALREFLDEARPGPWRRATGIASSEEEHTVYLTNDAEDALFVNADDVAMLVNSRLAECCAGMKHLGSCDSSCEGPCCATDRLRAALRRLADAAEAERSKGACDGWVHPLPGEPAKVHEPGQDTIHVLPFHHDGDPCDFCEALDDARAALAAVAPSESLP